MFAEEFSKYIGSSVYNEFNELAGTVIGYVCDGIGEVRSVIVRSATEVYEIPIERIEFKQDNLKVLSSISHEFMNIERKIKSVHGRFSNLGKISNEEVDEGVLNEIKKKTEESYKQLSDYIEKFKSTVESKLATIINTIKSIDAALVEIKLQYLNGHISKERFDETIKTLKETKERLKNEFNYYNNYIKLVDNISKEAVVEVLVQ